MWRKLLVLLCGFVLIVTMIGCRSAEAITKTGNIPTLTNEQGEEQQVDIPNNGLAIYPAIYTIDNYRVGITVDLEMQLFNELDYSTIANVDIRLPNETQIRKNPEYSVWGSATAFCSIVDEDLTLPANGSKTILIRLYVPSDEEMPDKWFFYIAYQSEGHKWGNYKTTFNGNFVFYPYCFDVNIKDAKQIMTWLTWGNSPDLIVRAKYGSPPENPEDGELVYLGNGNQVIKDWYWAEEDKTIDRQYTLFTIEDNRVLSWDGGQKLFYRAWVKYLENGVWKGKWDSVGQSLFIPEVSAKVLVSK